MKKIFRSTIKKIKKSIEFFYIVKVFIAEWIAILKKNKLYNKIKFNDSEIIEIDNIWISNYGKKISKKWHKLYISINSTFRSDYFPDYIFSTKLEPILNPIEIAKFYSDKGLTELIYKNVEEIKFPETLILNCSSYFYNKERNIISKVEAINKLLSVHQFIIKPTMGGSSGDGVKLVDLSEKSIQEKKEYIEHILNEYNENYIIQVKLEQHYLIKELYPNSINTIRLITYIVDDVVHHAPLSLRMGVGGKHVDNVHSGGIVIGLSDDGLLKKYAYQLGYCDSKIKFDQHPNTKIFFEGYYIPSIDKMIKISKKLHVNTPHLGIISWDFMIDESGEVVLVEGNYFGQSIWFPQIVNNTSIFGEDTSKMIELCR